jgi:hypothetical protein
LEKNGDLRFLYKKFKYHRRHRGLTLRDMANREKVADLVLDYITCANNGVGFSVTKQSVQPCWYKDCASPKAAFPSATGCSKCAVFANRFYNGSKKWGNLLSNSLIIPVGKVMLKELRVYV